MASALAGLAACQVSTSPPPPTSSQNGNVVRSIRTIPSPGTGVEIELFSRQGFPVRDEIAVLRIGGREFLNSRYPAGGDTRTLIFTLTREDFASVKTGDDVSVQYGHDSAGPRWSFGTLDKSLLDR